MSQEKSEVEELAKELFEVCEYPNPDKWDELDNGYKEIWKNRASILIKDGYTRATNPVDSHRYVCICCHCQKHFMGDKREVVCPECKTPVDERRELDDSFRIESTKIITQMWTELLNPNLVDENCLRRAIKSMNDLIGKFKPAKSSAEPVFVSNSEKRRHEMKNKPSSPRLERLDEKDIEVLQVCINHYRNTEGSYLLGRKLKALYEELNRFGYSPAREVSEEEILYVMLNNKNIGEGCKKALEKKEAVYIAIGDLKVMAHEIRNLILGRRDND